MKKVSLAVIAGQAFSYAALAFGIFFFIFATKYYVAVLLALFGGSGGNGNGRNGNHNGGRWFGGFLSLRQNKNGGANGKGPNGGRYQRSRGGEEPFVSIQLPFYNEKNVARRIIQACIDIDYTNYEILVLDDSRDETIEILKELGIRKGPPTIKFVHRKDRRGFKGGALAEALKHMDPRTEYIAVFDADFIPPPDILKRFIWYFGNQNGNHENGNGNGNGHRFADKVLGYFNNRKNNGQNGASVLDKVEKWYERRRVAAVQGYQLHHLNKNENWITKGVRAEFSGSYMIERVAEEFFGAMKMISGSVFMLKADVVKKLGWTTSITEDWDLTIRLYLAGYKVVYTPLIQAPAEIPTTIRRLVRQRMRWAEGHTFAVKKYFWQVVRSPMLTFREKLEFLYFSPYYLQSLFFLAGTFCWMIAELLNQHPWFWTATFGWCLILSNLFALPLMSLAGLFLEQEALEDFTGIFSFIVLSYVVTPFQAYAALKGLLEKEEGTWIRTLKTGSITDRVLQVRVRKLFSWILPERRRRTPRKGGRRDRKPSAMALLFLVLMSSIIVWVTVAAMSAPTAEVMESTPLSFEYVDPAVTVNGVETNRILTHPDYTELDPGTAHTDDFTTSNKKWSLAWSFYLYGPLEEDYEMRGKLACKLYLYASRECEVDVKLRILDLDEKGKAHTKVSKRFKEVELGDSSPDEPVSLEINVNKKKKFKEGHTILVEIWLRSDSNTETTYYLDYDSDETPSQIEFPGIVMPEQLLPLFLVAPLIPVAVLKVRNRREERC